MRAITGVDRQVGFNPRLRTGGDSDAGRKPEILNKFQSTPPHGRRHGFRSTASTLLNVSIHASAREATRLAYR